MAEVDENIVDVLAAAGIGLTKGTNLFMGPGRGISDEIPAKSVFVLASGGPPPLIHLNGGSVPDTKEPACQIIIRGEHKAFSAGQTLARAVYAAIHKSSPADNVAGSCLAQQSEPIYIGEDEQGFPGWTINVLLFREE